MASKDAASREYEAELRQMALTDRHTMTDEQMLALLLSYTNYNGDLKITVDALLERFGSYRACVLASHSELMAVNGMTFNSAVLFRLISGIYSIKEGPPNTGELITDIEELFVTAVGNSRKECAYIAAFDSKNKLLGIEQLASGRHSCVEFRVSDIVDFAAQLEAERIAVCHSHPWDRSPAESEYDRHTAQIIGEACARFGVEFIGQVIVAQNGAALFKYES